MLRLSCAGVTVLVLMTVAGATLAATPVDVRRPVQPALSVAIETETGWESGTAGASAAVREMVRTPFEGAVAVVYAVTVSGFAPGEPVHVWLRRRNGVVQFLADDVSANRHGVLVSGPGAAEAFLVLAVGYAEGEPFELAVLSADRTIRALARAVPLPGSVEALGSR